jgi:AraC-like DNA-binding protein
MKYFITLCIHFFCFQFISNAQSIDAILQAHQKAIGEKTLWNKIKTIEIEGRIVEDGLTIMFTKKIIPNKFYRYDYTIAGRDVVQNANKYFVLITPQGAWRLSPEDKGQVVKLDSNETRLAKGEMNIEDPFMQLNSIKLTQLADEFYLGKNHFKFQVDYPSGVSYYYYLNATDYHIAKRVLVNSDATEIIEYESYLKTPFGISIPKQISQNEQTTLIDKVNLNQALPESLFKL